MQRNIEKNNEFWFLKFYDKPILIKYILHSSSIHTFLTFMFFHSSIFIIYFFLFIDWVIYLCTVFVFIFLLSWRRWPLWLYSRWFLRAECQHFFFDDAVFHRVQAISGSISADAHASFTLRAGLFALGWWFSPWFVENEILDNWGPLFLDQFRNIRYHQFERIPWVKHCILSQFFICIQLILNIIIL